MPNLATTPADAARPGDDLTLSTGTGCFHPDDDDRRGDAGICFHPGDARHDHSGGCFHPGDDGRGHSGGCFHPGDDWRDHGGDEPVAIGTGQSVSPCHHPSEPGDDTGNLAAALHRTVTEFEQQHLAALSGRS